MWWFHGDARVNGTTVAEADVGAMLTDWRGSWPGASAISLFSESCAPRVPERRLFFCCPIADLLFGITDIFKFATPKQGVTIRH